MKDEREAARVPLRNLEGVVSFGYTGASPALMGACAKRNIALSFLSANGRFLARVTGEQKGNVLLRKTQYRVSEDEERALPLAQRFIEAKLYLSLIHIFSRLWRVLSILSEKRRIRAGISSKTVASEQIDVYKRQAWTRLPRMRSVTF